MKVNALSKVQVDSDAFVKEQISMEKSVNMVSSYFIMTNYYFLPLECPERLGENAFGISDTFLPLECKFN